MYEHNALGYWSGLALCLTKVRSSRARCPATALIFFFFFFFFFYNLLKKVLKEKILQRLPFIYPHVTIIKWKISQFKKKKNEKLRCFKNVY